MISKNRWSVKQAEINHIQGARLIECDSYKDCVCIQ